MPLSPRAIAVSMALICGLGVAVGLSGRHGQVGSGLLRLGLRGLLHGDEVGVGLGLDDQRDAGLAVVAAAAGDQEHRR